jgi:hypothetical protein
MAKFRETCSPRRSKSNWQASKSGSDLPSRCATTFGATSPRHSGRDFRVLGDPGIIHLGDAYSGSELLEENRSTEGRFFCQLPGVAWSFVHPSYRHGQAGASEAAQEARRRSQGGAESSDE